MSFNFLKSAKIYTVKQDYIFGNFEIIQYQTSNELSLEIKIECNNF